MITKIVADNWLDSRAKYIETKNLKRKRRSLTWISLLPLLQKMCNYVLPGYRLL